MSMNFVIPSLRQPPPFVFTMVASGQAKLNSSKQLCIKNKKIIFMICKLHKLKTEDTRLHLLLLEGRLF